VSLRERIILDLTMRGGEALIELRQEAGLSREVLAVRIGRASSTVELWEKVPKPIKNTDILRIAEELEAKLGDWPKASKLSFPRLPYFIWYPDKRRRRIPQLTAA